MAKTKKTLTVVFMAIFLFGLFIFAGCDDPGKEKAVAEAAAEAANAKAMLSTVKDNLAAMASERDDLKSKLETVTKAHDELKAAAAKVQEFQDKLVSITKERDESLVKMAAAQTAITDLQSKLAEHIKKIAGLEEQNKKLLDVIADMKTNIGGEVKTPEIPKL